jgi:glyoxylate/hydroxypyruvate reductase
LFARFAHLKVIFSLGAGVDHVVADPHLPDVPVVRIVDADLTMRMTEYVVLHVLMNHRRQRLYDAQQRARVWRELEQSAANKVAVGVMGLGVLGRDAARIPCCRLEPDAEDADRRGDI